VCELTIVDDDEFISFFETNYPIFKDYLIVINGEVSEEVELYLNNKQLKFLVDVKLPVGQARKAVEKEIELIKEEYLSSKQRLEEELTGLTNKIQNNLKVLDTLVRSGQELNIDGDLLLLNRVNSGGKIVIEGNLIVTQVVDGAIRCNGNFMMIQASPKANIVFHGVEVDNSYLLLDKLNKVELINNEIVITPVLKETNWTD
jgi:septum site-determining protein MinC